MMLTTVSAALSSSYILIFEPKNVATKLASLYYIARSINLMTHTVLSDLFMIDLLRIKKIRNCFSRRIGLYIGENNVYALY